MTRAQKPKIRLGDAATVASGSGFPTKFQGKEKGKYPFYKVSDMNLVGNESLMISHNNAIDEPEREAMKASVHPAGTIIFPKIGAAIATNKKRILSVDSCFDNNVIGIYPAPGIDTQYLYQLLKIKDLSDFANTGNPPSIRKTTLEDWQIHLPPFPEQQRVAAILDKADELRAKRREAIAELDKLVQATFLDMFGDPVTNPKGFDVTTLDAVTVGKYGIKAGPFGSALKKEFYTSSGYRVYGQEQVIAGTLNEGDYYIDAAKFESLRSCEVRSGDVLVSLVGSFGKTLIVPEKFQPGIINPRLLKITFDQSKVIPEFFQTFFRSKPVQNALAAKSHGGTMPILNAGILKALKIPLPPIDQQVRFSNVLEAIESKRLLLLSHQLDLENLFKSLQHRAFNGEL